MWKRGADDPVQHRYPSQQQRQRTCVSAVIARHLSLCRKPAQEQAQGDLYQLRLILSLEISPVIQALQCKTGIFPELLLDGLPCPTFSQYHKNLYPITACSLDLHLL